MIVAAVCLALLKVVAVVCIVFLLMIGWVAFWEWMHR